MSTSVIHPRNHLTFKQIAEGVEGIVIILAGYLTIFLKTFRSHWGLSRDTAGRSFPGDEIIPEPKAQFTHGVEIDAPTSCIWPWIAQIGQGRGGFYSYELLENLSGLGIYNADEILPEFQYPKLGDKIPFSDKDAYPLIVCKPGSAMAIETCIDLDTNQLYDPTIGTPQNFLHLTWLWYIEPLDKNRSRFISRNRAVTSSTLKNRLLFGFLMEPIIFAMDRKMCLGIKKRAERTFNKSTEPI